LLTLKKSFSFRDVALALRVENHLFAFIDRWFRAAPALAAREESPQHQKHHINQQ
jgi:hypothetical protein